MLNLKSWPSSVQGCNGTPEDMGRIRAGQLPDFLDYRC
jgi:hypothetical protein